MKKAKAIKLKSWRFTIINGILYKKYLLDPWLRFGLPGEIISDNGKQFRDDPFKDWSEIASIGEGIKAWLEAEEKTDGKISSCSMGTTDTMIKICNGDTLFSLTYGSGGHSFWLRLAHAYKLNMRK
ncbi:hypothetical protein Tco_0422111 [Tanacetum coccineum]